MAAEGTIGERAWGDVVSACNASAGFDEQTASASQLAACGITRIPVSKTETLPDGGTTYEYDAPSGQKIYVTSPPSGFNALTATPAERLEYGVPPAPPASDGAMSSTWNAEVQHWTPNPAGVPVNMYSNSSAVFPGGPVWAGYGNTATGWKLAEAQYTQPPLGGSACPNDAVSFWSGIGGYNNSVTFGQTGTADGENGWPNGAAWAEVDAQNDPPVQYPGNPVASTTASITALTQWDGTNNRYDFTIWIAGTAHAFAIGGPWASSDATAEEIVEHVPGTNISNFGTEWMDGYNGSGYSPIANHPFLQFTTGGMTTGSLSGAAFPVTQNNCAG